MSTTKKSMNWKNKPFLLSPAGKDYLWGGDRLKTDFHKRIELSPLAETWECSTHPDGVSTAASGIHAGKPLDRILREHPEYLGTHPVSVIPSALDLPVLVKLIDAREPLSIQVHPDDTYAAAHERGSLGKTEMWYVLDAAPGAHLIYGFNRDMNEELLQKSLSSGTIEKYLQKIPVHRDDIFFIEPGTVHAIGAGVLLAEIQENSNLTYRLYDYDRLDKNGQKRRLHIDKATDVLHYQSSENPRQPMRVLRYRPGCASELLSRCKYFQAERLLINTADTDCPECSTSPLSFQILLCIAGSGTLQIEAGDSEAAEELAFLKGDCLFLPADSAALRLSGKAQLLRISC